MKPELKNHEFKAEWVDDEHGPAVMISSVDGWDGEQTVLMHPRQLRSICEHFDLLPTGDQAVQRQLQTMARRLLRLRDRINDLQSYLANHSDHKHADLTFELVTVNALADLANEWCDGLEPMGEAFGEAFRQASDAGEDSSPDQPSLL